jgi:hypothetical protein
MKSTAKVLLFGVAAFVGLGALNQAQAYYDRYPDGYWDHHGHYRHYEVYHRHRGYWDERNGVRVFINL